MQALRDEAADMVRRGLATQEDVDFAFAWYQLARNVIFILGTIACILLWEASH